MEGGSGSELEPRSVTSRRRVRYRRSSWRAHSFEVWSGELVCRAAALRMRDSLLLWVGGAGEPALGDVAAGVPGEGGGGGGAAASALLGEGGGAAASALLGEGGGAAGLARRLTAALRRPVFVCCGAAFDRFTLPLVERGLITEIKNRPECF